MKVSKEYIENKFNDIINSFLKNNTLSQFSIKYYLIHCLESLVYENKLYAYNINIDDDNTNNIEIIYKISKNTKIETYVYNSRKEKLKFILDDK